MVVINNGNQRKMDGDSTVDFATCSIIIGCFSVWSDEKCTLPLPQVHNHVREQPDICHNKGSTSCFHLLCVCVVLLLHRFWHTDKYNVKCTRILVVNKGGPNWLSVQGGVHIAPENRPEECFTMAGRWLCGVHPRRSPPGGYSARVKGVDPWPWLLDLTLDT
jgi:hypothetical protein